MASTKSDKPALSDREMEILSNAWKCMKQQPEIDYTKLAAECGMTNIRSASNAWGTIKKKLFTDSPNGSPTSAKKRKPATKAAANKNDDDDEEANNADVETPTKKRKGAATKARPAKSDDNGNNDGKAGTESPTKKGARATKTKAAATPKGKNVKAEPKVEAKTEVKTETKVEVKTEEVEDKKATIKNEKTEQSDRSVIAMTKPFTGKA